MKSRFRILMTVLILAVILVAMSGVGYAYTAVTINSDNTSTSEYTVISQSHYTYSAGSQMTYYSVTAKGAYTVKVGTGMTSGTLTSAEDCFMSLHENCISSVVITGGAYAGTYTIDMSGVTLVPSGGEKITAGVTQKVGMTAAFINNNNQAAFTFDQPGDYNIKMKVTGQATKSYLATVSSGCTFLGVHADTDPLLDDITFESSDTKVRFTCPDANEHLLSLDVRITGSFSSKTFSLTRPGDLAYSMDGLDEIDTGPLDFTATPLTYDGKKFDNKSIGNGITVTYNELEKKYTVTGKLKYQSRSVDGAMDRLGMPADDNYGISFLVKNKTPVTRYFMTDGSTELFNGYYGKKIGDTNTLKINNVNHTTDNRVTMSSDTGFAQLYGGWRYILKVTDNKYPADATKVQYAMSDGEGWIYYAYNGTKWVQQDHLVMTQNVVDEVNMGYDTELFLAGPDANIDSLHYASGTAEPTYRGTDAGRSAGKLILNGTITFRYDSADDPVPPS